MGELVVEPVYQGNSGVFLFAKELLDAFKCITPVVMVRGLKEQENLKKLAQVIAETEEWFVTACCRCLIFALVDLVEKVVKLCDVVSEIRGHEQNTARSPISLNHEVLMIAHTFGLTFACLDLFRWNR